MENNTCEIGNCNEPTDTTINEIRYCAKHLAQRDEEVAKLGRLQITEEDIKVALSR